MATITLNPEPPAALGACITFTITDVPKKVKNPRVLVEAFQDGALVYGETFSVAQATGQYEPLRDESCILLGGGASIWLTNGGPAHCVASLFYDKGSERTDLASCEFDAVG